MKWASRNLRGLCERRVAFRQGVRKGACVPMIHQHIRPINEEEVPHRTEPVAAMRDILVFYRELEPHAFSTQPSQYWDVGLCPGTSEFKTRLIIHV